MSEQKKTKNWAEMEEALGLRFKKKELLKLAFVHKSFMNEHEEQTENNERLEFLGDAVLELVVTDYLYHHFPDQPEGQLTNWRSALVKRNNLAKVARKLKLGDYLLLSRGEEMSGGRSKEYILANTVESLTGAIYLDLGFEVACKFVETNIIVLLNEIISKGLHIDAKSRVQELAHEKHGITPSYDVISEIGPDHDKTFTMGIYFEDKLAGKGKGSSKQSAEEAAAKDALKNHGWL